MAGLRVLITGMEGFAGSHLAEYALARGARVFGTAFPGASRRNLKGVRGIAVVPVDITRAAAVQDALRNVKPDRVFHLAGQSNPKLSWQDPESTLQVNLLGTLNVLEAARSLPRPPRVLVVGSADEYGGAPSSAPIRETHPLRPDSPYAHSKVCQDWMGLVYFQRYGLHVVRVRPFNHVGPRQALGFVATDFASQIAAIEKGRRAPVVEVGNLDVVRDIADVRDIVAGYWILLEKGRAGEVYNLGSGRGVRLRDLLRAMLALSPAAIRVRVSRSRIRTERPRKVASIARVRRQTGWRPRMPLARTLRDILEDWRERGA